MTAVEQYNLYLTATLVEAPHTASFCSNEAKHWLSYLKRTQEATVIQIFD